MEFLRAGFHVPGRRNANIHSLARAGIRRQFGLFGASPEGMKLTCQPLGALEAKEQDWAENALSMRVAAKLKRGSAPPSWDGSSAAKLLSLICPALTGKRSVISSESLLP